MTLPNPAVDIVPSEGDPAFPSLDSITFVDLVGPSAANRQPVSLRTRDTTLRDRVNLLIANNNFIATGVSGGQAFLPRDGAEAMVGNLNMGSQKITSLASGAAANDAVNYGQLTSTQAAILAQVMLLSGSQAMTGDMNLGLHKIIGVTAGVSANDAVNFTQLSARVARDGTTPLTANWNISGGANDKRIVGLQDPVNANDAANKQYADSNILTFKREISGDPSLSCITVGESGCDYTTIEAALAYVGGKTRNASRQMAVLVFERRAGLPYQPAGPFSIPSFTHMIAVGRVRIDLSAIGATTNAITFNEGSRMEGFKVAYDDSATNAVLYSSGTQRVIIRDVEAEWIGPAANFTARWFILCASALSRVERVRLTGSDQGYSAVSFGGASTCECHDCDLSPASVSATLVAFNTSGEWTRVTNLSSNGRVEMIGARGSLSNYNCAGNTRIILVGSFTHLHHGRLLRSDAVTTYGIVPNATSTIGVQIHGLTTDFVDYPVHADGKTGCTKWELRQIPAGSVPQGNMTSWYMDWETLHSFNGFNHNTPYQVSTNTTVMAYGGNSGSTTTFDGWISPDNVTWYQVQRGYGGHNGYGHGSSVTLFVPKGWWFKTTGGNGLVNRITVSMSDDGIPE
jgi:hypothetical protein